MVELLQYLNLLPFSVTVTWFIVLMLIINVVDFLQGGSPLRLPAASMRDRVKAVIADILVFAGMNGLLLYVFHPLKSQLPIALVAAGLLVTYFLTSGMRKQLLAYRPYALLIHVLLGLSFYLLFGMLLMGRLIVTYNLNMSDQFDILYFVYGQDRPVVYGVAVLLVILYFVIGKLLMRPLYSWYAANYYKASRVNIKLVGGETLTGVYILRDKDRRFLAASSSLNPGEGDKLYRISRDRVEYMERDGSGR